MKVALFPIAAVVAMSAAGFLAQGTLAANPMEETASLKGKPAPEIALKTLDGNEVKLSDMKGKVVLIDAWATWCPPCRESLPHVQKLSADQHLQDKGLVVWAVDLKEDKPTIEKFLKDNHYTFTVLRDDKDLMHKSYLVSGIPTTIIVGRDGTVKETFLGYGGEKSAQAIDDAVHKALAEPAPGANVATE